MSLAVILLLALTRAEIIERMRAPVVTQAGGLVQVFANCPADMRREYQSPIARFAADTVETMYRAYHMRPRTFRKPGIIVHVGESRTNVTESLVVRVMTNDTRIVTRLYVRAPGHVHLGALRYEIIRGFHRSVKGGEISMNEAARLYRGADPTLRVTDMRNDLTNWKLRGQTAGGGTVGEADDEAHIALMKRIIEPGVASTFDILVFDSRLMLYAPYFDQPFANGSTALSFREAACRVADEPRLRALAYTKTTDIIALGAGRSPALRLAALHYAKFLAALAEGDAETPALLALLDEADIKLNIAYEEARLREEGKKQ